MRVEIQDNRALAIMECAERGLSKAATGRKLFLSQPTIDKYTKLYSIDFSAKPSSLDLAEVRAAAAEGLTRKQAVDRFGVCYSTIHRLAHDYGIHFPRSGTGPADAERATAMEAMYRGGKTLAEIGELYGVSRERVRQILSKHQRMTADEGGQAFKARINREKSRVKKEALCQEKYGCSLAERRKLLRIGREMVEDGCGRYRTPTYAFTAQKSNARARGIDWNMTLLDWWRVWDASGKWAERGRGQGFMMCRFGDTGAYEIGNVYIATGVHNGSVQPNNPYRTDHPDHSEVVERLRQRGGQRQSTPRHTVHIGLPVGVTRSKGRFMAQCGINGKSKYLGSFRTPEEAHQAYLDAISAPQARAA